MRKNFMSIFVAISIFVFGANVQAADTSTPALQSSDNIEKFLSDYESMSLSEEWFTFCLTNTTKVFFHDSAFAWAYRARGGGDIAAGLKFGSGLNCHRYPVAKDCVYRISGTLYYRSGGKNKSFSLKSRSAPAGKCYMKTGWRIVSRRSLDGEEPVEFELDELRDE